MLAEAIVATAVLTTALVALAQLFAMSVAATDAAKSATVASVLADRRAEEIRTLPWASVAESGSAVDYFDERGGFLASGGEPPAGAMYVRRWSAARLPARPDDAVVVEIFVGRVGGRSAGRAHITRVRARHAE